MFNKAYETVLHKFDSPFPSQFKIYVHPNRASLDKAWQTDWQMPSFKSQCWMVASGVAKKMDLLSPQIWDSESCEHSYTNKEKTQKLITHEMIHVYHAQINKTIDFSDQKGLDWFIEGLAVFASGQLDETRINELKVGVKENKIPQQLEKYWSGTYRYGISGMMVTYLHHQYGMKGIKHIMTLKSLDDLYKHYQTSEKELINGMLKYVDKNF